MAAPTDETRQLELAARFTDRLWSSPFADFLNMLPKPAADEIATTFVVGLLKDVTE